MLPEASHCHPTQLIAAYAKGYCISALSAVYKTSLTQTQKSLHCLFASDSTATIMASVPVGSVANESSRALLTGGEARADQSFEGEVTKSDYVRDPKGTPREVSVSTPICLFSANRHEQTAKFKEGDKVSMRVKDKDGNLVRKDFTVEEVIGLKYKLKDKDGYMQSDVAESELKLER